MRTLSGPVAHAVVDSPLGPLTLHTLSGRLTAVRFGADDGPRPPRGVFAEAARQLAAYFDGELHSFDLPLDLSGLTPFQRSVCQALRRVPYGRLRTYGDLARALGRSGAARAVGGACARNPLPIVLPCHRVVAGDGSLGGYSGGLELKRALLGLERGASGVPAGGWPVGGEHS